MWLFYSLVFLTLSLGNIKIKVSKKSNHVCVPIIFFILGVMMMFRAWSVGNDTKTYVALFEWIRQTPDVFSLVTRYEIGYLLLNKGLSFITPNPQILFIVIGAFVAYSFARYFRKYSNMPWLSVLMFMCLGFMDLAFSGMRQILAVSILLFAYDSIVEKKPNKFVILCLLAASMHTSAIVFLIAYPLAKVRVTKRTLFIAVFATIVAYVGFDSIILGFVDSVFPIYLKYFTSSSTSFSSEPKLATVLMLFLWTILILIAFITNRRYCNSVKYEKCLKGKSAIEDNVALMCILIGIVLLALSLHGTILNRFKLVLSFPLLTYYPNALAKINQTGKIRLLIMGSVTVFILYITIIYVFRPEWQSTFPYQFCL